MTLPFLALFLLAADPPMATAPASAPPAEAQATAPQTADAAPADPDYLPKGAPADDFAFTAWCRGVLSGHMDLGQRIKDVLPLDPVQEEVGHAYLKGYDRALQGSPESKTIEGKRRAEAARKDGWDRWEAARNADKLLQKDTYLNYSLPGRCEHAAIRLSKDPNLFRHAPSADEVAAMPITLSDGTVAARAPVSAPAASPPAGSDSPPPAPQGESVATAPAGAVATAPATDAAAPVAGAATPDAKPAPKHRSPLHRRKKKPAAPKSSQSK